VVKTSRPISSAVLDQIKANEMPPPRGWPISSAVLRHILFEHAEFRQHEKCKSRKRLTAKTNMKKLNQKESSI
jgi:hypothetical protein